MVSRDNKCLSDQPTPNIALPSNIELTALHNGTDHFQGVTPRAAQGLFAQVSDTAITSMSTGQSAQQGLENAITTSAPQQNALAFPLTRTEKYTQIFLEIQTVFAKALRTHSRPGAELAFALWYLSSAPAVLTLIIAGLKPETTQIDCGGILTYESFRPNHPGSPYAIGEQVYRRYSEVEYHAWLGVDTDKAVTIAKEVGMMWAGFMIIGLMYTGTKTAIDLCRALPVEVGNLNTQVIDPRHDHRPIERDVEHGQIAPNNIPENMAHEPLRAIDLLKLVQKTRHVLTGITLSSTPLSTLLMVYAASIMSSVVKTKTVGYLDSKKQIMSDHEFSHLSETDQMEIKGDMIIALNEACSKEQFIFSENETLQKQEYRRNLKPVFCKTTFLANKALKKELKHEGVKNIKLSPKLFDQLFEEVWSAYAMSYKPESQEITLRFQVKNNANKIHAIQKPVSSRIIRFSQ